MNLMHLVLAIELAKSRMASLVKSFAMLALRCCARVRDCFPHARTSTPSPEQNFDSMVCSVTTGSFHACGTASAPMVSKQPYCGGFPSPHDSRGRQHVVSIIFRLAMPGSGLGHSASPFKTTEAPNSHNSLSARRRPLKNRGANRTKPADPQAYRAALADGVRGAAPWAFAREIGGDDLGLRRLYSLDNDM